MSERDTPCGFVCKRCGGPAPMGVGFVGEYTEAAAAESRGRTACPCGYSVDPRTLEGVR